jgi:hypothetical protein
MIVFSAVGFVRFPWLFRLSHPIVGVYAEVFKPSQRGSGDAVRLFERSAGMQVKSGRQSGRRLACQY